MCDSPYELGCLFVNCTDVKNTSAGQSRATPAVN